MFAPEEFLDLSAFAHRALFAGVGAVWEALPRIPDYLARLLVAPAIQGEVEEGVSITGAVAIGEGTRVEAGVKIVGPAVIGRGCHLRQGAYLRGQVVIGDEVIVGHATELKSAILLDRAHAPHFNYVGDSILGSDCNLGAGTICSNVRLDLGPVRVRTEGGSVNTGLLKFGAVVGQGARTGCHVVLNPGTLLGRGVLVWPGLAISGYFPRGTIQHPGLPG